MRIIVCVKQVYDPKTIRVSRSREELDLREAVRITNPPDRYALEAALRLREVAGGEVIALTVGDADAEDAAREAVAVGADRAVLLLGSSKQEAGGQAGGPASPPAKRAIQLLASSTVTRILAAVVDRLAPVDLVLAGQIGLTDGSGGLPPRLAAALGWSVVLDAVRLEPTDGGLVATVGDRGATFKLVPLALPAVVAVAPGPDRPRYPHPARIAKAWAPELLESWTPADLGLGLEALASDTEPGGLILGPERLRGQVIGGAVDEATARLVGMLRARRLI
jgi:electron transfer flavoprotein beta subunit